MTGSMDPYCYFADDLFAIPSGIGSEPGEEAGFVKGFCRETQNGLSRVFLACGQTVPIDFEKEHADDEAGPLVAVDKRIVAYNPSGVGSGQFNHVWIAGVRLQMARPCQGRREQAGVTLSGGTAI